MHEEKTGYSFDAEYGKELVRLLEEAQISNEIALEDGSMARKVAATYRHEYEKVLNSRFVKAWLKARKLLGKEYRPIKKNIPGQRQSSKAPTMAQLHFNLEHLRYAKCDWGRSGSSLYSSKRVHVGIITDEFMFNYYGSVFELEYLSPSNYKEILSSGDIDYVLYVSCWRGMNSTEPKYAHYFGDRGIEIACEVIRYARSKEIKTLFQSIEDPVNYQRFLPIASECDYIFTTAVESIESYKEDCPGSAVNLLTYGVNPLFHNPTGFLGNGAKLRKNRGSVFFAGSWYPDVKERCEATRALFDSIIDSGADLFIADRHFKDFNNYYWRFPKEYEPYLVPSIDHTTLQKVHKTFDFTLNLNTVIDSKTMCAMRVYEVQALGGLLISNVSESVARHFPGIFEIARGESANRIINGYSPNEIISMQIRGIRRMMSSETVFDRVNEIFEAVGEKSRFTPKKVYLAFDHSLTLSPSEIAACQTFRDFEIIDMKQIEDLLGTNSVLVLPSEKCFKYPNYLIDLINAFKYTDAQCVGYTEWGNSCAYAYSVYGNKRMDIDCAWDLSLFESNYADDSLSDAPFYGILAEKWGTAEHPLSPAIDITVSLQCENSPTFIDRCFRSLLRQSAFNQVHLIVCCTGHFRQSDYLDICQIVDRYENITVLASEKDCDELLLSHCLTDWRMEIDPSWEINDDALSDCIADLKDKSISAGSFLAGFTETYEAYIDGSTAHTRSFPCVALPNAETKVLPEKLDSIWNEEDKPRLFAIDYSVPKIG